MIKWIKRFFTSTSPRKVIEAVLKRDISWVDYEKLTNQEQLTYYNQIQQALLNDALQNEIRYLLADWVSELAQLDPEPDKDKPLRWSINALELLLERLRSIPDPKIAQPTNTEINEDI